MKRIFTADTHLSLYGNDRIKQGISERLYDIMAMLEKIVEYAYKNKISQIIIGGDLCNDKDIIYTKPFVLFSEFLERHSTINFIILSGNHDLDNTSDDQVSIVTSLKGVENVECIINLTVKGNITYIPFSRNVVDDVLNADPNDILISHFGLNEGSLNSGISIVSDIGIKQLKHFPLVLLGHYHKAQEIKSKDVEVYYVGSPIQKDWGEKHQEKRFLEFDDEKLSVKSIPLEGYTQYIELEITDKDVAKEVIAQSKELKEEGHHVRVRNKTENNIVEAGLQVIQDSDDIDVTNRGVSLTMSFAEKCQKYMQIKEIPEKSLKKYMEILNTTLNL